MCMKKDGVKLKSIIKRNCKNTEDNENLYRDFAPVDYIGEESEYFSALDWALQNKRISNIALSAPYGAGKSSVIESYIKARKLKALQLSLANFDDKKNNDVNSGNNNSTEVEKEFLKKLFYKVDYKKIPQSRYRKLHKISFWQIYAFVTAIAFLFFAFCVALDLTKVKETFTVLKKSIVELKLPNVIGWGLIIAWIASSVGIVSYILKRTFSKWKNWEISVSDKAKVKTEDDSDKSIFDKYLDEIIYFFEETDYEVVFIEDLDRFKAIDLFTKLRELNVLLNRYESIKRHITFVYAIRDDYFPTGTDRTKFFDYIIPIIPYINATNSDDLLRRRIDEIEKKGIRIDIGDEYITKIASYIGDMRVLTSIVNEFITYKRTVKKDDSLSLKDEELFSLMVFKNLYPKEFADIESEKGIIKEAFSCKESFISDKNKRIEEDIRSAEEILSIRETDILKDVQEIKQVMFQAIAPNNSINAVMLTKTNARYTYDQIMDASFDLSLFENENLVVYAATPSGAGFNKNIADIEKEYTKNHIGYIKRWKVASDCADERINELRKEIEKKKNEVYKLKATRLQKLIEDYGSEAVFEDHNLILNNQLLVFLLRNGYIDETYVNYINYYHPDSITPDEHEFILNLRNYGGIKDYAQCLMHPDRVVDKLVPHEFRQIEILNFSLTTYLVTKKRDSFKATELFGLLSMRTPETKEFIQRYIQAEPSNSSAFINKVAEFNCYMWKDIECDETIPDEEKVKYFDLVMQNASTEAIVSMEDVDSSVSTYMIERVDIFNELKECSDSKLVEILKTLNIKLRNTLLEGVDPELFDYIYQNNAYEINPIMVGEIIKYISPESYERSKLQNYTVIRSLESGCIQNYINENIDDYVKKIVVSEENCEETQEAIEEMFERIGFDPQICIDIVSKQNTVFKSLDRLKEAMNAKDKASEIGIHKIIDSMMEQDKLQINWNVIETYYNLFGITEIIFDKIEIFLDELLGEDFEVDEKLVKTLILCEWSQDDKYRKFVEYFEDQECNMDLADIPEPNLKVLLDLRYIPFSLELVKRVKESFPSLSIVLFERYKEEIIKALDEIPVECIPYGLIFESKEFSNDECLLLVKKCDVSDITEEIALFIMHHEGGVDKKRVLAAWNILPDEKKYELLVNHIEVLDNKELPALFNQLASVYHSLALRTNHKVSLDKTGYNEKLLNKLKKKGYLTSVGEEEVFCEFSEHENHKETKTMLFCRVRAAKGNKVGS